HPGRRQHAGVWKEPQSGRSHGAGVVPRNAASAQSAAGAERRCNRSLAMPDDHDLLRVWSLPPVATFTLALSAVRHTRGWWALTAGTVGRRLHAGLVASAPRWRPVRTAVESRRVLVRPLDGVDCAGLAD